MDGEPTMPIICAIVDMPPYSCGKKTSSGASVRRRMELLPQSLQVSLSLIKDSLGCFAAVPERLVAFDDHEVGVTAQYWVGVLSGLVGCAFSFVIGSRGFDVNVAQYCLRWHV